MKTAVSSYVRRYSFGAVNGYSRCISKENTNNEVDNPVPKTYKTRCTHYTETIDYRGCLSFVATESTKCDYVAKQIRQHVVLEYGLREYTYQFTNMCMPVNHKASCKTNMWYLVGVGKCLLIMT